MFHRVRTEIGGKNAGESWSKTAQYPIVARWRCRNVTNRHENLYLTFQQGSKHLCCKDATYKTRLKDFTVSMKDEGDRKWQSLLTLHFKVKGKFSNNTSVGGGFIGSTPRVAVASPFAAVTKPVECKSDVLADSSLRGLMGMGH